MVSLPILQPLSQPFSHAACPQGIQESGQRAWAETEKGQPQHRLLASAPEGLSLGGPAGVPSGVSDTERAAVTGPEPVLCFQLPGNSKVLGARHTCLLLRAHPQYLTLLSTVTCSPITTPAGHQPTCTDWEPQLWAQCWEGKREESHPGSPDLRVTPGALGSGCRLRYYQRSMMGAGKPRDCGTGWGRLREASWRKGYWSES